jgi:nucleoside phosphorylase
MSVPDAASSLRDFADVTIGILTALSEEYAVCKEVFDPDHQGTERNRQATSGALTCWICEVPSKHGGAHVIAITLLPQPGNSAAAIAANILLQHCPNIHSLIMCGIAGAVPQPAKPGDHVRLGDIVVSDGRGIIQYDFGKQRDPSKVPDEPFAAFEFRSPPRAPCSKLLLAVKRIEADEMLLNRTAPREWETRIKEFLMRFADSRWRRPASHRDRIIDDGSGSPTPHPREGPRRSGRPRVFHGPIGAANIVLADPKRRDALRDRMGIKAVEMEGSGVADASWVAGVGYIVVRGTCDYCNSTKNDDWHHYAALIAAAYARTLVSYLHVEERFHLPAIAQLPPNIESSAGNLPSRVSAATSAGAASVVAPTLRPAPARSTPIIEASVTPVDPVSASLDTPVVKVSAFSLGSKDHIASPSDSDSRLLQDLIDRLSSMYGDARSIGVNALERVLESQLRARPPHGAVVRAGWLLLGRFEARRLHNNRQAGRPFDVARLNALRREAERVTD